MTVARDDTEAHDESYFASFTDLLVGVLFVFIILLMVFAGNLNKQTERAKEATEEARKATEAIIGMLESRNTVLQEMRRSLKEAGVTVTVDEEQGILRLPESVLFDLGKDALSVRGTDALAKLAGVMRRYLPCLARLRETESGNAEICATLKLKNRDGLETVLIEGHTDSKGSDKGFDNWGLSARRSINVFRQLTQTESILNQNIVNLQGYPVLAVSAYESRRPVNPNAATDDELKQNRRIDLRFIMRSPTPEDVKRLQSVQQ
ncbi:MAG: OmpA family protein [Rickettsiales bacterium]